MQVISGTSEVTSTKTIEKKRMTLLEIYRKFYTDSIIDRLGNDCVSEDFIMGIRHTAIKSSSVESCKLRKTTTNHYMCVKKKYLMQAKAIQIGLIANEQQCESLKTLKENIEEIRQYFFVDTGVKPVGREIIERIISKCLFTKEYAEEVSKNFQSIIPHFNQSFFGGDEKIFLFLGATGYGGRTSSGNCRRTVGLWLYESCGLIKIGCYDFSFLLYFSTEVTNREHNITSHGIYPQSYEACENFNAFLKIFTWPHKRVFRRYVACDAGRHNNFVDAAMLHNTYNAYCVINEYSPSLVTFEMAMITLAVDLYSESLYLDKDNDHRFI